MKGVLVLDLNLCHRVSLCVCAIMGADLSFPEEEGPVLSNTAARDACVGKLGRGQLINSHGSSVVHSAVEWREQVQALVNCDDAELCQLYVTGSHLTNPRHFIHTLYHETGVTMVGSGAVSQGTSAL